MKDYFSKYGPIISVQIKKKNSTFAFIEFQDMRDAENGLKEDGSEIKG